MNSRRVVLFLLVMGLLAIVALAVAAQDFGNYSGDDEYDPAAGAVLPDAGAKVVANYSGDDDYDQAATGRLPLMALLASNNYSGDDDYDPCICAEEMIVAGLYE